MDLLNTIKNNANNGSARSEYSLTEIVGILTLLNEGMKVADISLLTGRSVNSLRYKFLEKKALKGQSKPRSIHQYESMSDLFAAYGEVYSDEDLQARVAAFKKTIEKKVEEV